MIYTRLKVSYLSAVSNGVSLLIIAFTLRAWLTSNDSVNYSSFGLDKLFNSFFHIYKYDFFNRFFNVNCLDFCLGSHLITAFEIREKVLSLNYNLSVVFKKFNLLSGFIKKSIFICNCTVKLLNLVLQFIDGSCLFRNLIFEVQIFLFQNFLFHFKFMKGSTIFFSFFLPIQYLFF